MKKLQRIKLKLLIIAVLLCASVALIFFSEKLKHKDIVFENTSTLATTNAFITINNNNIKPYRVVDKNGHLFELIILEESFKSYHPSEGWRTPKLKLTAWEHGGTVETVPKWTITKESQTGVFLKIDETKDLLTINLLINEEEIKEKYRLSTGKLIK
jgi:hypothetical protein